MVKPRQDFLGAITRLAEDGSGVVDGYGAELHNVTIVLNERIGVPSTGFGRGSFWVQYDGYEGRPKFTDRDGYTIDLGVGRDGYITSTVYWYQITGTPTSITGYNITDAVNINDYRLTDSRTPTNHANSHLFDGYDPIDGYRISLNYSPINYISPINQTIGEHLGRIDDKLGLLSGNIILASRTIATTAPLQGGGTLATDLNLSVSTVGRTTSGVVPHIDGYTYRVLASIDGYNANWLAVSDSFITSVAWTKITGTPTTLGGYGITDAASKIYVDGYFNTRRVDTTAPLSGGGSLSSNLTLAVAQATNATSGVIPAISVSSGLLGSNNGTSLAWLSKIATSFITAGTTPNTVISSDGYNASWTQVSNAMISSVAWNKITGTPTTLTGYGITDALQLSAVVPVDVTKSTAAIGLSVTAARSDHKHDVSTGVPSGLAVGGSNAEGAATSLARSDHLHSLPAFGTSIGTFAQGNDSRFPPPATVSSTVLLSNGTTSLWGKISDGYISDLNWSKITNKPTTLSGYGITDAASKTYVDGYFNTRRVDTTSPLVGGGSLASNLTLSINSVSNTNSGVVPVITGSNRVLLTNGSIGIWGQISDGYILNLSWSKITGVPTTISGYNITDAASKTYVDGYFNTRRVDTTAPLSGGGSLSSNLNISIATVSNTSFGVVPTITGSNRVLLTNGSVGIWGQISDGYISDVNWNKITNNPTTLSGYEITDAASKIYVDGYFNTRRVDTTAPLSGGGSLASNLNISVNSVSALSSGVAPAITGSNRVLLTNGSIGIWGQISDGYVSDVNWSKITSKPTTLSGYGITDAASKIYVDGYFNTRRVDTTAPLQGGGSLSSNLNLSINSVSNTSPGTAPTITGANRVLLTNGIISSWSQISDGYILDVNWNKITNKPTTLSGYGITDAASKIYVDGYFNTRRVDTTAPLAGGGSLSSNLNLSIATVSSTTAGIAPILSVAPFTRGLLGSSNGTTAQWLSSIGAPFLLGPSAANLVLVSTGINNTVDYLAITEAMLPTISWTKLTGYPTINTTTPLTGGGDLSINRTLNINNVSSSSRGVLIPITGTDTVPVSYDGNNHTWAKIEDRLVSATAAIAVTKLALGGANTVILSNGTANSWGQVSNAYISDVAWTKISSKPTTLTGYGITDAVPSSRTINTTAPLAGGGSLASNLTLSISAATTTALGTVQLTSDLGGTGASPSVLKLRGAAIQTTAGALPTGVVMMATGTVTCDWNYVRDPSIASDAAIAWSKIVHPNIIGDYQIYATGDGSSWVRIGTYTAGQSAGYTIRITAYIHQGYNASNAQDSVVEIIFKTSNGGSVDANGFAGNSSYYITGQNTMAGQGLVKWVANAAGVNATAFTLYMYLPAFTGGSHYSVHCYPGTTWTDAPAGGFGDPGIASSTVCIATHSFTIPHGEIKLSDTNFTNNIYVTKNISLEPHPLDTSQNSSTIQFCSNGGMVVNEGSNGGSYNISPEPYYHSSLRAARWYQSSGGFSLTGPSISETLVFLTQIHGQNVPASRTVCGTFFISWLGNGNLTNGSAQLFLFVAGIDASGGIASFTMTNTSSNGHLDALPGGNTPLQITSSATIGGSSWNIIIQASSAPAGQVTHCVWKIEYGWANS